MATILLRLKGDRLRRVTRRLPAAAALARAYQMSQASRDKVFVVVDRNCGLVEYGPDAKVQPLPYRAIKGTIVEGNS